MIYEYEAHTSLMDAADRLALWPMRRELPVLLQKKFGSGWMDSFVHPILRHYESYKKQSFPEDAPLSALDLTPMWFLLFPYDTNEKGELVHFDGAGEVIREERKI